MNLRTVRERFERLIDPATGIIAEVERAAQLPGEPDLTMVTARLAAFDRIYPIVSFDPMAAGTALDPREAWVRACGEAIERYAGFLFPPYGPRARYSELPGRGLPPADWPCCKPEEHALPNNPLAPPDPERVYDWVQSWSLTRREPVYLPAMQVCMGYVPEEPGELINIPHSTGLAAGATLEQATLSGLCEVLERDAFMLTWGKRLTAPRVIPPAEWEDAWERYRRVARWGLQLSLHALLPERPPARILALLLDPSGGSVPVACGLGASPDPERAVAKAIDEAVQTRRGLLEEITQGSGIRIPENPAEVESLDDHLYYYLNPKRLDAFSFLLQAPTMLGEALPHLQGDAPAMLDALVNNLNADGYEAFRVDVTPVDLDEAGFRVARVIVPGLVPLTHGHATRFLGSPRWDRFPGAVTAEPHPFG